MSRYNIVKKKQEFIEKFDFKEYQVFVKEAFKKSDAILIYLNKPVMDVSKLSVGMNAFIGTNLIRVKNCDDDKMSPFVPYATVEVDKNFEVFEALKRIAKWEDFYGEDEESDYHILALDFLKNGSEIAFISSHYVGYDSEFGWY